MGHFAQKLIAWQKAYGRHHLPWQVADPYRVWLSEIMLQQTQVTTVLGYYHRFLERFPTLHALAEAPLEDVLQYWSGLGYYSRARNLHRAAQKIVSEYAGQFPTQPEDIECLPGIGRSTAGAIAVFAFNQTAAILDGNVKRVLTRYFGLQGFPGEAKVEKQLWQLAHTLLPSDNIRAYTQGLMDLGATICVRGSRARCMVCPLQQECIAAREARVAELPAPRPKKPLPTRCTIMVLATWKDKVWLQRRPPTGVWGGLLSLPEFDTRAAVDEWLAQRGIGEILPAWAVRTHAFTHYRLMITPQPVRLSALDPNWVGEPSGQWVPIATACDSGVPAPVKKILQTLLPCQT